MNTNITQTARGKANVRAGLLNGEPAIIFEDAKAQQVQLAMNGGLLQLASGTAVFATADKNGMNVINALNVQGNTTLGKGPNNTLTFKAASLSIPNNLNIGSNALFVDGGDGVAIGTNKINGYKLNVAGNAYTSGSLQTGGQIIIPRSSAGTPSIGFAGNTNTGLFSPGTNIIGFSAGGKETLRVQSGTISTQNGANLNIAGYLQAGSGGPSWKVARFTGRLDGSGTGSVSHGISSAPKRVLLAMAWYEGSSGQAKFLSVDFIDNVHFQVSGGVPGSPWRGVIMYTSDNAGW